MCIHVWATLYMEMEHDYFFWYFTYGSYLCSRHGRIAAPVQNCTATCLNRGKTDCWNAAAVTVVVKMGCCMFQDERKRKNRVHFERTVSLNKAEMVCCLLFSLFEGFIRYQVSRRDSGIALVQFIVSWMNNNWEITTLSDPMQTNCKWTTDLSAFVCFWQQTTFKRF